MATDYALKPDIPPLFTNPWPLLIGGIAAIACGTFLSAILRESAPWLSVLLLAVGAVLTAGAIWIRSQSAVIWGLAALAASLGSVGFRELAWDSAQLLFLVLMAVSGLGAILVQLPVIPRRIVISVLLVVHFGGILTAVTSAPPAPWLSLVIWNYFYRPYLQFMYLNNAYHFYSPEPGPAKLMWFCIEYEPNADGSKNWRWVKVPDFDAEHRALRPDHTRLWPNNEYTRRLSLAESIDIPGNLPNPMLFAALKERRLQAASLTNIPPYPDVPLDAQYRPPSPISLRHIQAYVRHVAQKYQHERNPDLAVKGVKVYRVIHSFLNAKQLAEGWDPFEETLYQVYFQGDFDKDGNRTRYPDPSGLPDPFLNWLIPIVREPEPAAQAPTTGGAKPPSGPPKGKLKNYVLTHAGVKDEGVLP